MTFTDIFINRPVLAIVVSSLLLLLGLQAASQLSVRHFPKIEKSVIYVTTDYPGASARTVQGFVTTPLQQRIASARGVEYITSSSNYGTSSIEVHVRLGENSSDVLSEVIAKINEARYELPRQIEDPVVTTATGSDVLIYLAFISKELSIEQMTDYLLRSVQPELSSMDGVGSAKILGDKYFAMRVWLDPIRMAALGVTAEDVRNAIQRENYISAAGTTEGNLVRASVYAKTDMEDPAVFADIVVRQAGDLRVCLGDVADLEMSREDTESSAFSSGRDTVFVAISTAPGANPLEVAKQVHDYLPRLKDQMPADMEGLLDYDYSMFIDEALFEVLKTLLEAVVIVILVIYLFLGSLRVVFIPLVVIPLSLIGVMFLIYAMGFSLNILTLLAMVISIGLVVDDAIVVVENVHRHIEEGATPMEAALKGARQVALPVIAMTLTLAAVYAPIGFMGGLTGTLFTEFALTLAGAVFVSGIIALTLSPMMSANVLRDREHQGKFPNWLDDRFNRLRKSYQQFLRHSLNNRGAVFLFSAVIIGSLPVLFGLAQEELAPEEDSSHIYVMANAPQYANLDYINRFLDEVVTLWKGIPEVSHSWQESSPRMIIGGLVLKHWDERERTQKEIQQEVQAGLSRISGLELFSFGGAPLPGSDSGLPVNFVLASTADYREVDRVAEEVVQLARESGIFIFVTKDLKFTRPEITVSIDRDKAARLGISMQSIGDTLAIMLGEADINRFSMEGRSYKVIPQASPGFRLTKEDLEKYYLRTSSDELVPLATVITLGQRVEPNSLTQYQQLNCTSIQGMLMPPNTMGTGLEFLEQAVKKVAPVGFRVGYEGQSRRFKQEGKSFAPLFTLSLLLIFLVLAVQFNSFRDPLVVLMTVPLSIFGAVVPIALGLATLNIYTQIGLLTLIGLISKHGILIVEFANQLVAQGLSRREAVLESASLRLRPILMTTAATVLGVVPLLLAFGAGANSRFSIGLMIAAGMLVGTLFTLFVVPVFYLPFKVEATEKDLAVSTEGDSVV
jgi:multidrug efflux pump